MNRNKRLTAAAMVAASVAVAFCTPASATPPCEARTCPSTWLGLDTAARRQVFALADDYKSFMGVARSALTTVTEARRRAEAAGFREWRPSARLTPGSRWYANNRGRALTLWVVGSDPISSGVRISASHIDSVHLELKARPLYQAEGFALLQTQVHGGLLTFEWGNTPLALVGRVDRKDGSHVDVSIGLKPSDPVFMVAQLSPHVDSDLRARTQRDVLAAEELDPIVGNLPLGPDGDVRAQVAQTLRTEYGIGLDDFVSAELALVPAMQPRDLGFDRSLMAMYGQDDRFAAYASLDALFEQKTPKKTAVVALFDNEEVGDVNNSGAGSDALVNLLRDLLATEQGAAFHEPQVTAMLHASKVVSTDVNDAVNPIWPQAWEGGNAPRVGQGVNIKVYGQGNNPTGSYMAWLRRTLDDAGVPWQTATYKVGRASGGTLGGDLSRHDMDVVDLGAPVLSIHHTYDISSKVDLWWLRQANTAFFSAAD